MATGLLGEQPFGSRIFPLEDADCVFDTMPSSLRQEEFLTRADHVLRGCVAVRVLEGVEARRAVGKNIADSVSIQGSLCYRRSAPCTPAGGYPSRSYPCWWTPPCR